MFLNVGYFDSMGILAVSCFQRNLISLPLAARRNTICILVRSKLKKQTNKAKKTISLSQTQKAKIQTNKET